jgi:bifunctional non-homologous end joining protein LigD
VTWDAVDDPELHARRWTIADAVEQAGAEPWADLGRARALGPARRRLATLRD